MVGTLFKHDMKALTRILLPVNLAGLCAGILAIACTNAAVSLSNAKDLSSGSSKAYLGIANADTFLAVFAILCTMLLIFTFTATFVIVLTRFYKNLFTDEGYLTFTLPVPTWMHLASKYMSGAAWVVINLLLLWFCFAGISAAIASGSSSGLFAETDYISYWFFSILGNSFTSIDTPGAIVISVLGGIRATVVSLLVAYAAFALGAAVSARHKVAAGIGFYVLISWALGIVKTFIFLGLSLSNFYDSYTTGTVTYSIFIWIIDIAIAAGCWAFTAYMLKHKVNLA